MSFTKEFDMLSIKDIFPVLDNTKHKGQCGRIGIIGGSQEYTGAPYFAGMSALRLGADLVHIFCTKGAGTPIKCYSPELIVHPILDDSNALTQIDEWSQRLHGILIGPGLGRDPQIMDVASKVITGMANSEKSLVIDADGLHIITLNPNILVGAKNVTLTPNKIEYQRLCNAIFGAVNYKEAKVSLINYFGPGVTIVLKGEFDEIFNQQGSIVVSGGSPCRCGGQGDVLSGSITLFTHWAHQACHPSPALFGAFSGCTVTKKLSETVFKELNRSMVASDLIPAIPKILKEVL